MPSNNHPGQAAVEYRMREMRRLIRVRNKRDEIVSRLRDTVEAYGDLDFSSTEPMDVQVLERKVQVAEEHVMAVEHDLGIKHEIQVVWSS